ncbi:putative ribonuclease H-like domain-containing protein [Tanacetum coccineum]
MDDGSNNQVMMERWFMERLRKIGEYKDQEKEDNVNSTNNVNAASTNEVNVVGEKPSIELLVDQNMPALEDISIFDFTRDDEDDDFVVGSMDVKMCLSLCKGLEEEVYVCQPPGFEDPDFPDREYKVEKALYGLHQAPRAWYETLSTYLLDNGFQRGKIDKTLIIKRYNGEILLVQVYVDDIVFGSTKKELCNAFAKFTEVKTASTPLETQKPLLKDEDDEEVDVHMYRSMIGSLMYLTSTRPDIMFSMCACARYQVNPKVSHLHDVKRIFRYLKGQQKLGLWYPKDCPFDLVAYTNSDYARASLDKKYTTGGCQFLGSRLISWQCKKKTVVLQNSHSSLRLQVQQKKDGIFLSQDKYVGEILRKFRFSEVKTTSTPMETQKPLLKDKDGKQVDVHMYRSMIGSLMYLTSSRPDIMFALCASYIDSDYVGASLDGKSTTGGYQFLESRLISWQCKKQTVVANSTTEAEYVTSSS